MGKDDPAPRPQRQAPRSRLSWRWPIITYGVLVSAIGFWLSGLMAIVHELHLQFLGSGWWQIGGLAIGWFLFALVGFIVKVRTLYTGRVPKIRLMKLLDFNLEAGGFAFFLGYGILSLSIHPANLIWTAGFLGVGIGVVAIAALITMIKPIRRRLTAVLGSSERDGQSLISEPAYFSRRIFLSGGIIFGMGAAGLVTFWRAFPALIPDYTFFGHDSPIRSLSWFPDGRRIASADDNGRSFIWNADDGTVLQGTVLSTTTPTNVSVSPDGKLIAASDFSAMYMIDVATATLLWKKDIGYSDHPFSWAPDSAQVVVLSHSDVRILDAATGSEATTRFVPPENFTPNVVAWSPNGTLIVAADGVHVVMWDATSGVERKTFTGPDTTISELAWSPNGDSLAFAKGDAVYIWLLRDTEIEEGMGFSRLNGYVPAISWSPDGRYIAFCVSLDKTVCVIEIATSATVFVYNGHFSPVWAVAWSPDGRRIASGGFDNLVHVWRPVLPA